MGHSEKAWRQQHEKAWQEVPPSVRHQCAAGLANNPWFRTLPVRSRDLLLLSMCRHRLARRKPLAMSVHTSLSWSPAGSETYLPTLVPSGMFWLGPRCRPLLGIEAVRLQGCDPTMLPALRREAYDSAFLMNLAGNAFCVYQFCAWFLAALAIGDLIGE